MNRFVTLLLLLGSFIVAKATLPALPFVPVAPAQSEEYITVPPAVLNDTIPPVITCPPNDTITLGPGGCDTVYSYSVTAFDSLTEITPLQLLGQASGDTFHVGTTINTFVALDTAGNTAGCSFTVTVLPATNELICLDTVELYLGVDCWVSPAAAELLSLPYGCTEGYTVESDQTLPLGNGPWVPAFFDDADRDKLYEVRVTNPVSNSRCWAKVRISDTIPPTLECPEINVPCALPTEHLQPDFLKDTLGIAAGMPTLIENCPGNGSLTFVDVENDLPCDSPGTVTGTLLRFWTAVDASNNVATCVQTINRHRSLDDVLLPADITVSCGAGREQPASAGAPYVEIGMRQYSLLAAPLCEITATYSDSIETLDCDGTYRIHRSWIIEDMCRPDSTPVTGTQLIDVEDSQGPGFQCALDTTLTISASDCRGTIDLPDILVTDSCSYVTQVVAYWTIDGEPDSLTATLADFPGNDLAQPDTLAVFDTVPNFPVGTTSILYVATDACGNTASCELTLRVLDDMPPEALCDSFQTVYVDVKGVASLSAGLLNNGSSDACSDVYFKVLRAETGQCDTLPNLPNDLVNICCADVGDTLLAILRVYDVPVPAGMVADTFAAGHFSACAVPVRVLDDNPPHCEAPDDVTVFCEAFDSTLAAYGSILPSCNVDSMATETDYELFDTLCRQGTIIRTFSVFDTAGQTGQCVQHIIVQNVQNYFVRFPDDLVVNMCDTSGNYGTPELYGIGCEKMAIDYQEQVFTMVPDACFQIERTWTIFNWCTYDPNKPLVIVPNPNPNPVSTHPDNLPGPVVSAPGTDAPWNPTVVKISAADPAPTDYSVFWMADANGYQYKQVIKVIDLEIPVIEDCPAGQLVFVDSSMNDFSLWNANYSVSTGNPDQDLCEGSVTLGMTATDACFGADLGVDFILFLDLDDDGSQETVVSSTDLPSAGTVYFNNANTPNYSGGVPRSFDNRPVAANEKYQFAIVSSTGNRRISAQVVWNTPAAPSNNVLPQLPLGNHRIQWTVYDGCGNESTCVYDFRVESSTGTCAPTELTVGGVIETESNAPVANVAVSLDGTHPNLPTFNYFDLTDASGAFDFMVPTNASYTVTPLRDDDDLNGVSTFDLLLINKHVLGLQHLNSPYKIIAADANHSNSVTTFDIVEFRKLILGLYQQLPSNTSWRFVPKDYLFADPDNPFLNGFPELEAVTNLLPGNLPVHNFIGIKIGDVNGNVNPGLISQVPDDRSGTTAYFDLPDQTVRAGDLISVPVEAAGVLAGFQWTLSFTGLEMLDLIPGPGLSAQNFAVFANEHAMTASWDGDGRPGFTLRFRALQSGRLSQMLDLSSRITRAEAYDGALLPMPVALRYDGNAVHAAGFEVFQNRPNPFSGATTVGFYLPQAKTVHLTLYDAAGRLLFSQTRDYTAGFQSVELNNGVFGDATGLLYYQLETDTDRAVRKMLRL